MFLKRLLLPALHRLFSNPRPELFLSPSNTVTMAKNVNDETESLKSSSHYEDQVGEGEEESSASHSGEEEAEEDDGESEDEEDAEDEDETPPPMELENTNSASPPTKSRATKKRVSPETGNGGEKDANKPSLPGEEDRDEGELEEEGDHEAPPPMELENTTSAILPENSRAAKKPVATETENGGDKDAKSSKKNNGVEETKKSKFQRVFTEDDEEVILEGFFEYKVNTGAYPGTKINEFRNFISKSLPFEVTSTQLYEKIRRLKRKYENNCRKGKDTFKIPHEQIVFDLSKKIWDTVEVSGNSKADDVKTKGKQKPSKKGREIEVDHANSGVVSPLAACLMNVNISAEELVMKHGLEIIKGPKKQELEEKWKQFRVEEMKLHVKRLKLLREQGNVVLKSLGCELGQN